jgi:hypothetical protein
MEKFQRQVVRTFSSYHDKFKNLWQFRWWQRLPVTSWLRQVLCLKLPLRNHEGEWIRLDIFAKETVDLYIICADRKMILNALKERRPRVFFSQPKFPNFAKNGFYRLPPGNFNTTWNFSLFHTLLKFKEFWEISDKLTNLFDKSRVVFFGYFDRYFWKQDLPLCTAMFFPTEKKNLMTTLSISSPSGIA